MKMFFTEIDSVIKMCGYQNKQENQNYRRSKHCVSLPCEEGELLYHTFTGALVLIPTDEDVTDNREELIKHWFLVPHDFDECRVSDDVRRVLRLLNHTSNKIHCFTVLTTTDCNARCFYCYELGIRRFHMTKETAQDIANHIIKASGGEPVTIKWFGGEPLYNTEVIDLICDCLRDNKIIFESEMTTNGFYFDEQVAHKAVRKWHLKKTQITLDGTETVYNRTKAYIDSVASPFQKVIDNIETALHEGIAINIRLNMDASNREDLLLLVDLLAQRFGDGTNLKIYVSLLHELKNKIHGFVNDAEALDAFFELTEHIDRYGLLRKEKLQRKLRLNHCMADNSDCEVIMPDGRICRCEHIDQEHIVGSIHSDERDEGIMQKWKERYYTEVCPNCTLYPMCTDLRECPENKDGCTMVQREIRMRALANQIIEAYNTVEKEEVL